MPKAAKALKTRWKFSQTPGEKKPCNNTTGKAPAVFISAVMPPQLGGCALCKSTATAGVQQVVAAGWVLGGILIDSGLPWQSNGNWKCSGRWNIEQAPSKKGFLHFISNVCTKPCRIPGFPCVSWWKSRTKEQSFWRSLILRSCRLSYILHLFNGEERACHCLHQSSSNPQPLISLIFSLPALSTRWKHNA